jgi:hypothetical protein
MLDREHGVTSSALYKDFLMERQSILDNCSPPYDEAWLFLMTLRVGTPGENLGREPEWFSRDPFAMLGDERPGKFVSNGQIAHFSATNRSIAARLSRLR